MGFIYEVVPEADLEFLKAMKLKDCWGTRLLYVDEGIKWCADRELNAYLVNIGGGYHEMPKLYDLWWNGKVVRIEVEESGRGNIEVGVDVIWLVNSVPIPQDIWDYRDEIMKMIEDAFSVNQSWCDTEFIKSIEVRILCEPEIREDR